jgi:hypothetical protein
MCFVGSTIGLGKNLEDLAVVFAFALGFRFVAEVLGVRLFVM